MKQEKRSHFEVLSRRSETCCCIESSNPFDGIDRVESFACLVKTYRDVADTRPTRIRELTQAGVVSVYVLARHALRDQSRLAHSGVSQ